MKKYLLPEKGNFYKANLHCHTTVSDGQKTPQEVKEIYQKMGYSIVAFTDHDIFIPHNDLTDGDFLALNGFEVEIGGPMGKNWRWQKGCHICFVALDSHKTLQPMWNEAHLFGNAPKYKDIVNYDKSLPPYVRRYSGEGISEMMQIGRDAGFFVTYNHPSWSLETYNEYINYNGMHAIEMFNGGCIAEGYDDYNPRVYDDLLYAGKKIFCIGADDNHNGRSTDDRRWDSGVAFTVIKAESLDYKTVTDALLAGNFYCSQGPAINALWVEDGKIHIECSEADRIICKYEARCGGVVYAPKGETVTQAEFDFNDDLGYARITVIDKEGKHACTNAYFPE